MCTRLHEVVFLNESARLSKSVTEAWNCSPDSLCLFCGFCFRLMLPCFSVDGETIKPNTVCKDALSFQQASCLKEPFLPEVSTLALQNLNPNIQNPPWVIASAICFLPKFGLCDKYAHKLTDESKRYPLLSQFTAIFLQMSFFTAVNWAVNRKQSAYHYTSKYPVDVSLRQKQLSFKTLQNIIAKLYYS